MKTLIVVDADVEFSSLYKTSQTRWHSQGAGFVSIEYFYLVDDEFAAKLTTSPIFFSTGEEENLVREMIDSDVMPFAVRSSGNSSFSRLDITSNASTNQPAQIKAMIKYASQKDEISKIYRFVHNKGLFTDNIVYVNLDTNTVVDNEQCIARNQGSNRVQLTDEKGNVITDNAVPVHLMRMYGYWLELDKDAQTIAKTLDSPPRDQIEQMVLNDKREVLLNFRGGQFEQLFEFLSIRQDKNLINVAKSWQTNKRFYQPVNILGLDLGIEMPECQSIVQAKNACIDMFKNIIKPELARRGSNVIGFMPNGKDFTIQLTLKPGSPAEDLDDFFGRDLIFTVGKRIDAFTVKQAYKKVMAESKRQDMPELGFWLKILDKLN